MLYHVNTILAIAQRDFLKLLRDRTRIIATFIFPFLFIGILGSSLQSNIGDNIGYNFMTFVFAGVLGQTFFQSTAAGIISLIEDRENDFSQEMFVSPVSRYSIIIGKITGETAVALVQGIGIIAFGLIIGVPISLSRIALIFPAGIVACLMGGAFGIFVLSNLNSQRSANQIFPFVIFPQFFLAGVFNPIQTLPLPLLIASRLAPMTYAVDLVRSAYYLGTPESKLTTLHTPLYNLAVLSAMFTVLTVAGTYLFVRNERNK